MDVRAIRLEHIQEYVNRLEDMSASTIKKQKLLLSQVLEHAVLTEVIQRNPVEGVEMPPMTHNTKEVFPYEKDEQEKLVTAFTEEKTVGSASAMDGEPFLFWRQAFEPVRRWRWSGATSTKKGGR